MTYVTTLVSLFPILEFLKSPSEIPLYNFLCLSTPTNLKTSRYSPHSLHQKQGRWISAFAVPLKRNEGRVGRLEGRKWKGGRKERKDLYTINLSGIVIARDTWNSKGRIPQTEKICGHGVGLGSVYVQSRWKVAPDKCSPLYPHWCLEWSSTSSECFTAHFKPKVSLPATLFAPRSRRAAMDVSNPGFTGSWHWEWSFRHSKQKSQCWLSRAAWYLFCLFVTSLCTSSLETFLGNSSPWDWCEIFHRLIGQWLRRKLC